MNLFKALRAFRRAGLRGFDGFDGFDAFDLFDAFDGFDGFDGFDASMASMPGFLYCSFILLCHVGYIVMTFFLLFAAFVAKWDPVPKTHEK